MDEAGKGRLMDHNRCFLLVLALLGCPGQNPESRKTVVCVCVCACVWRSRQVLTWRLRRTMTCCCRPATWSSANYANYYSILVSSFHPRNAVLAWVLAVFVSVCACVCHTPVLYRNVCTDWADFLLTCFSRPVLRCVLEKFGYLQKYWHFPLELCPKLWT